MENNLKQLLTKDHSRTTNSNLVQIISGVYNLIGKEEFNKIINVQPQELDGLEKKELIDVIQEIQSEYEENWETKLNQASSDIKKYFESFLDMSDVLIERQNKDFSSLDNSNASNANFATELGSIDFANLIAGPLNACVTAQNNASMATVTFIESVAFDKDDKLRMVDFSHKKMVRNPNFGKKREEVEPNTNIIDEKIEDAIDLKVPFISLLNVPSLRIENCEIDFNVKLNSVYSKDISSEFALDVDLGIDYKWVKFDVSTSYKRSVSTGVKIEKEYTMGVKVVATNDQLPGGLENVLGILAG